VEEATVVMAVVMVVMVVTVVMAEVALVTAASEGVVHPDKGSLRQCEMYWYRNNFQYEMLSVHFEDTTMNHI
jgi:hypothetical protein